MIVEAVELRGSGGEDQQMTSTTGLSSFDEGVGMVPGMQGDYSIRCSYSSYG